MAQAGGLAAANPGLDPGLGPVAGLEEPGLVVKDPAAWASALAPGSAPGLILRISRYWFRTMISPAHQEYWAAARRKLGVMPVRQLPDRRALSCLLSRLTWCPAV